MHESEMNRVFPLLFSWEAQRELLGTRDGKKSSHTWHGGG